MATYPEDCQQLRDEFDKMQSSQEFKDAVERAERALGIPTTEFDKAPENE